MKCIASSIIASQMALKLTTWKKRIQMRQITGQDKHESYSFWQWEGCPIIHDSTTCSSPRPCLVSGKRFHLQLMPMIHSVPIAAPEWDQGSMMMGLTNIRGDIPMVKYVCFENSTPTVDCVLCHTIPLCLKLLLYYAVCIWSMRATIVISCIFD